ncbi:MAG TPA: HAD-IIIA family hydrolase [Alphaproteobacteria bacterium]|nr:HAD-IIIA family hydrolase [Alphaproteobacteria bacterium]
MTDFPFLDENRLWCQVLPGARRGGAGLFLDRDGVVAEEVGFLHRAADAALVPGAAAVIAAANKRGLPVVLVTNQSGIGRGYYGWQEFAEVQEAILDRLAAAGARIDAVYACAHYPHGQPPYDHPNHPARKPNPGMLLRAAAALDIDLGRSWLVGDRSVDVEAARAAGLAGALHVLTGHGAAERDKVAATSAPGFELRLGDSIADILPLLPALAERRPVKTRG